MTIHEWQIAVYLRQERDLWPLLLCFAQARHKVYCEVRVATQAVMDGAVLFHFADLLREHVDSSVKYIAYHMGVVAAHVTLLSKRAIEKASWLEIKLRYSDVLWQLPALAGSDILQFGIAAEESLNEWLQEAPFEIVLPGWSRK